MQNYVVDRIEEIAEMMIGEMPADTMMYVISNNQGINGAVSMLYENELHTLAEKLETDLYLLPSSSDLSAAEIELAYEDEREYISIQPRDFVIMTSDYQHLANNSFLLSIQNLTFF